MKSLTSYITERYLSSKVSKRINSEQEFCELLNRKIEDSNDGNIVLSNIRFNPNMKYLNNLFDDYIYNQLEYVKYNTKEYEDLQNMLDNLKKIKVLTVNNWSTGNVKSMNSMFQGLKEVEEIHGLDTWDLSNVDDMELMFSGCEKLTTISNFETFLKHINDKTSIANMLFNCKSLDNSYKKLVTLKKYEAF